MSSYLYQATYPEAIEAFERYVAENDRLVAQAKDYCDRFNLGRAGFNRNIFTWSMEFAAVRMSRADWEEHYKGIFRCPSNGYSAPLKPKKGQPASEAYTEFEKIKGQKSNGDELKQAVFAGLSSLGAPGLHFCNGALYIESPIELPDRDGLVELTQSQYNAATKSAVETESC